MEDSGIIALYTRRDQEAIRRTAEKYGPYCYRIAHNILLDASDAEEVVNDTYLKAWSAIPPHQPRSLKAFLGRIARRTAVTRFLADRATKRGGGEPDLALEELGECVGGGPDPQQELEAAELARLLSRFVRGLPEPERQVFVLRYWYIEPISAIAERYGFSQSKVKSMLFRTRNKLRALLRKEGIIS